MRYWSAERRNVRCIGRGSSSSASSLTSKSCTIANITPKDKLKHSFVYQRLLVELICDSSLKGRRKGVKGHLKANVNGKVFWVSALCFTKRGQAKNCETDKCGCPPIHLRQSGSRRYLVTMDPLNQWLTYRLSRVFPNKVIIYFNFYTFQVKQNSFFCIILVVHFWRSNKIVCSSEAFPPS